MTPHGKSEEEAVEVVDYVETVEPLLRPGATVELDGRRSVSEPAGAVQCLVPSD
jgi:hypothetical protein